MQPERTGTASPFLAPNQVFQAADTPFTLAIVSDRQFELFASVLGRPDLAQDYPTNEQRMANRSQLVRKLAQVFKTEPADHWVSLLGDAGLPVGHVLTINEALADPQARHDEMTVVIDHPVAGKVKTTGSPIRIDRAAARAASAPPSLGRHTRGLLHELGVDPGTIEQMIEEGTAVVS
jgi:formyl-CoA transferase